MYLYAVRVAFLCTFPPVCPPEDLLVPNVSWNETPVIQNGEGVYSFSGGNVTYNGVSLGSTATYRTTLDYRINGSCVFESRCEDGVWTPPAMIESASNGCYYLPPW